MNRTFSKIEGVNARRGADVLLEVLASEGVERLPVTFIVMNNREYNVLKDFTKSQTDYVSARTNQFVAMDIADPCVDYLALANAQGVPARRIDRAADIAPSVEVAIQSGVTNLIEIPIAAT